MWVSIHVYRSLFTYVAYCRKPLSDSRLELVSLIGLFSHIRVSFHICGSVFYIFGVLQQAIERLRIGVGLFNKSLFPYMGLFWHIWRNAGSDWATSHRKAPQRYCACHTWWAHSFSGIRVDTCGWVDCRGMRRRGRDICIDEDIR